MEISNINELYDVLYNTGPVYGYYTSEKSAHLIVITGVDVERNIVYTNNPWGVKGTQSFEEFQTGVAKKWYQSNQGLKFDAIYLIN